MFAKRRQRTGPIGFLGLIIGFIITAFLYIGPAPAGEWPVHELVVLHTNDTHGHPVKFDYYPSKGAGGLPARATLVKRIRAENENVLLLDAGDLNTGRPESNLFQARPDIEGYNDIGYDAMTLGNHEFDHTPETLEKQMGWARFPFLSANVKTKTGDYPARPYIIKTFEGFKAAVFGLTLKQTESMANQETVSRFIFEDEILVARELVPQLKKKADLVIALVHMGIYPSTEEGMDNHPTPERGSIKLATEVPGIDLIIDGHSHTRLDAPMVIPSGPGRQTIIVQAWKWGLVLGRVDLRIRRGKIMDYRFEAIPINLQRVETGPGGKETYRYIGKRIEEDQTLLNKLAPYVNHVQATLSEVIGRAEGQFFQRGVREMETALGDIIADSMKWHVRHMGVDFAIQNGGGIRAPLAEGNITKASIYEILPFDNTVVVLTLKGTDVRDLFQHIAAVSMGSGAFPQVSDGVRFRIDREARRCENIRINGKPIDLNRTYRIATNSYLANGGDGYKVFLRAVEGYDASVFQRDVLIGYIKHLGGRIRPETHHRIQMEADSKRPESHVLIRVRPRIISGFAGVEGDRKGRSVPYPSDHREGHEAIARPGQ